jgi:hypothetical protein
MSTIAESMPECHLPQINPLKDVLSSRTLTQLMSEVSTIQNVEFEAQNENKPVKSTMTTKLNLCIRFSAQTCCCKWDMCFNGHRQVSLTQVDECESESCSARQFSQVWARVEQQYYSMLDVTHKEQSQQRVCYDVAYRENSVLDLVTATINGLQQACPYAHFNASFSWALNHNNDAGSYEFFSGFVVKVNPLLINDESECMQL